MKLIATWKMSYEAMKRARKSYMKANSIGDVVEMIITEIEDNPDFHSVGYSGLPNREGVVELDAAFMDGTTLGYGAIAGVQDIKNPIKVARSLIKNHYNTVLVGTGANQYAQENGFEFREMLSEEAKEKWIERVSKEERLTAYDGHDTVCVIGMDNQHEMVVGVSTSGLFMKHPGRIGDSPIIGSGYYCDSLIGGAAATGLGEDIMRGCLSIRIVEKMKEGILPQEACEQVLKEHLQRLQLAKREQIGGISLIAMNCDGEIGAATNEKEFPFVVTDEKETVMYSVKNENGSIVIEKKDEDWVKSYLGD